MLDAVILLLTCGLLYYGASWQIFASYSDAAKYQCYAVAFWQGMPALQTLPQGQCEFLLHPRQDIPAFSQASIVSEMRQLGMPAGLVQFVAGQSPDQPYHALPHEYPLLTMLPFLLGMVVDTHWYQVAFALWMALFVAIIYVLLARWRSRRSALAFALFLVIGGWGTVLGRFDIIPSCLTLVALLCALRKRWNWAFLLLALATLFKFYALVLIIPFLLVQQREARVRWYAWRRWAPIGVFLVLCIVVVVASLLLSAEGTLAPLGYFLFRPIQIESLTASFLWLLSLIGGGPLTYAFTFGSLNVFSPVSPVVSLLSTLLLVAGVVYTCWLQWRGKIDLAISCLFILLIVMIMSKVFSPQYLIWVVPLVAYVGGNRRWWVLCWSLIGLLTTCIYPYIYMMTPSLLNVPALAPFYPATTARNLLLLGFIVCVLYASSRKRPVALPVAADGRSEGKERPSISVTHNK